MISRPSLILNSPVSDFDLAGFHERFPSDNTAKQRHSLRRIFVLAKLCESSDSALQLICGIHSFGPAAIDVAILHADRHKPLLVACQFNFACAGRSFPPCKLSSAQERTK
jgi:hypothetical protein